MTSRAMCIDDAYLNSLKDFPALPPPGFAALGEVNGQFEVVQLAVTGNYGTGYESVFARFLENHIPVVNASLSTTQTKKIPSLIKTTTTHSFLLDEKVEGFKGVWTAWMESGLFGTLEALEKVGIPKQIVSAVRFVVKASIKIRDGKRIAKTLLFPHLKMTNVELINTYAPIRDWAGCWIRALSWHPRLPQLAMALHDDSVKIFVNSPSPIILPILKAPEQKFVSCIAWHPYVTEFVVGVESGYIIWTLHPPMKDAFPTSKFISTVKIGHAPVTSVDYSSIGDKMLTSSPADASILIWNLGTGYQVPLYRLSSGGVPRASFSPNTVIEIFANTPSKDFRIWEYENCVMRPKTWRTAKNRVEAFAWHPSGEYLFFVSDSVIFRLTISYTGDHVIHPVFDLGQVTVSQQSTVKEVKVGGNVVQIEWDPTGKRLVILLSDSSIVPVLRLLPGKNTCLVPCGFISGHGTEYPVGIAFQKDFQHGALLTIAWSSERLQYFPFIFTPLTGSNQKAALNSKCRIYSNLNELKESGSGHEEFRSSFTGRGDGDSFKLFYSDSD